MRSPAALRRTIARAIIPANLAAFDRTGLAVERIDDTRYDIASRYAFFPATGFWRSHDGSLRGYGPGTLIADARIGAALRAISETPAGRDSGVHTRLELPDMPDSTAESAGVPTSSKLSPPSIF